MKRGFPSQTLVHNGAYAPQICLGIVVLGHDDLGSLCSNKQSSQLENTATSEPAVRKQVLPCTWESHTGWQPWRLSEGAVQTQNQLKIEGNQREIQTEVG